MWAWGIKQFQQFNFRNILFYWVVIVLSFGNKALCNFHLSIVFAGLFEYSNMQYGVDRADDAAGEPSIGEMTEKAIKILQRNPKGYFLFVEGE